MGISFTGRDSWLGIWILFKFWPQTISEIYKSKVRPRGPMSPMTFLGFSCPFFQESKRPYIFKLNFSFLKRLNLTNKIIVKSEKFEYFDSDIDFKRHLKGTEKGQSEKDSCWKRWTAYKNPKIPFSERHGCSRIHWIVKEKVILEMLHIQGRAMDLIIPGAPFFPRRNFLAPQVNSLATNYVTTLLGRLGVYLGC